MKKKKNIIIIIASFILAIGIGFLGYSLISNKNKLTVAERNWINENIGTIQNINVINNADVFGLDGSGVFYDFLSDFEETYGMKVNPITFNAGSNPSGITFNMSNNHFDIDFYTDHYVLVSKNHEVINEEVELNGKVIGILNNDLSYVSKYLTNASNVTFTQFDSMDEMILGMNEELNYMIVPLHNNLDVILSKNYYVVYHFSDIKVYYGLNLGTDKLSSILKKYYNNWDSKDSVYNDNLFKTFTSNMGISEAEVDSMQSVTYNYGFVNASPYEVLTGGKYGGIVAVYLSNFSSFADVEFNFVKYKNFNKFKNAKNDGKVDLYFDYYNYSDEFNKTDGINIEYAVVARRNNNIVIKSVNSLINETVYVMDNSKIEEYLNNKGNINIKTIKNEKELFKLNKKDVIIVLDKKSFDYYKSKNLDNYSLRYSDYLDNEYTFKVRINSPLYKLLDKYVSVMDPEEFAIKGLNNHYETLKSGGVLTKIAEYILYFVILTIIVLLILFKRSKKVTIAKKIKKDDKMKFIDQLTCLKNRNFLNENIASWNNNTIYPQTIVVVDLNKLQEINDSYGYNEGDKQIKALANILVKTQIDNSEILRTDGNEFVIYLVGYSQKQVSNYIFKLNKEIKKLPYDFGAEFGLSMIEDNIKTIEDALNEAVEDMKKNKESHNENS